MKSKLKRILFIFLSFLVVSCSNLFQAQKEGRKGSVTIQLPGPAAVASSSLGTIVTEQALTVKKDSLIFNITVKGDDNFNENRSAASGEKIEFSLEEGDYSIEAVAYNSDDTAQTFPLYRGVVDVKVVAGKEIPADLIMSRVAAAEFIKNAWGSEEGQYNYTWGGDVVYLYPEFDKVLKKGDKATVTFKGIANTAYTGKIDATFAKDYHYNGWTQIAKDSKSANFKAGDEVTLSFDLIVDQDIRDKTDVQFNLFYDHRKDFDEVMAFNEYSINFDFNPAFEVVEHKIHVGAKTYSVYVKKGTEYTLPTYDDLNRLTNYDLWAISLEGLYKDKDFSGTSYTKLTAAENKASMDFYAKLSINFNKNIWGDPSSGGRYYNYCAGFTINNFAEGFDTLPKSGETVKYVLEGIAGSDFDGYLGSDLVESSKEWTSISFQRTYVSVKKGEKISLYYEQTVPEGKSFVSLEKTGFNFCYDYEDLDTTFTISNFKVTMYGDKYSREYRPQSGKTPHMTLSTNKDGIYTTVSVPMDGSVIKDLQVKDLNSGSEFRIYNESLSGEGTCSFVWPLCVKDKLYKMEISYHKDDEYHSENAYCVAGGGLGEADYTDFDKMSIALEPSDKARYVKINNFAENNYKIFKNQSIVTLQGVEVILISGPNDWSDTEWVYTYWYSFADDDEDTFAQALKKDNKFDILTTDTFADWITPRVINEKMSARKYCYIGTRGFFDIEGYESVGRFYSKEIQTGNVKYDPFTYPDIPAQVIITITYPENYVPDFEITRVIDKSGLYYRLFANILDSPELNDVTYYWYLDNELISSGSEAEIALEASKYKPKQYNAKCIATYEDEAGTVYLEADFNLTISSRVY